MRLIVPRKIVWFGKKGNRLRGKATHIRKRFLVFGEPYFLVRLGNGRTRRVYMSTWKKGKPQ